MTARRFWRTLRATDPYWRALTIAGAVVALVLAVWR